MKGRLLIIIDLQKGWRHKTETEAAMLRAVEFCRQFKADSIHCCFKNDPKSLFFEQLHWSRFSDDEDTAEIPEIAELKLRQYWRSTYSCVTPELEPLLDQYEHVYIAGVFTDISVAATAMDLFDRGIPVSVISDCVATLHGRDVHEAALRSLEHAIGRRHVVPAASLLD
jgi:nicotinamidase-related amidase